MFSWCGIIADAWENFRVGYRSETKIQREWGKTKVNTGGEFARWRNFLECLDFNEDAAIAEFLIDSFTTPVKQPIK